LVVRVKMGVRAKVGSSQVDVGVVANAGAVRSVVVGTEIDRLGRLPRACSQAILSSRVALGMDWPMRLAGGMSSLATPTCPNTPMAAQPADLAKSGRGALLRHAKGRHRTRPLANK
jgi:hypothetical protein